MAFSGQRIHFMGIGGIGVSALAEMALARGAIVSGCDRQAGELSRKLATKGVAVAVGHDPAHVANADRVVYSSAIPDNHPERIAAGDRAEKRGRFLARFLDESEAWGVSGTHGKTTTSWLLAHILLTAGRDPSVFIGGVATGLPEGNYRLGTGPFVAELDESDGSFLLPRLDVAVVTNVESDHLTHYGDYQAIKTAFRRFANGVAATGRLIAGWDDPGARELFMGHAGKRLSFGFDPDADLRGEMTKGPDGVNSFLVRYRGVDLGVFSLNLLGAHNVLNALAAMGACLEAGVAPDVCRAALATAGGVARRLERLGTLGGASLYTDYAHHPTEVAASIAAIRARHPGALLVVFQPHLYSRTRDYAEDFGRELAGADAVQLLDVYPAREDPIPGIDSGLIGRAAAALGAEVFPPLPLETAGEAVRALAGRFEAVVMMGAGSIDGLARELAAGETRTR